MNKYLKLFKTEDDFKSCLDAKIAGNNDNMGFPNVSVIGEEDSNGNFSASDVFYIKDLNKAQAVHEYLRLNGSRWINPTDINIISSEGHEIKTLSVSINNHMGYNGYPENWAVTRFQPYDWYDKKTNTTYYAFISNDAYENITSSTGNINVLDGEDISLNLLNGYDGSDPNERLSSYNPNNPEPPYHGKIIYVTDLSGHTNYSDTLDEIYERTFNVDAQGNLTFNNDIKPFEADGAHYYGVYYSTSYDNAIEGYIDLGSGSGSGN